MSSEPELWVSPPAPEVADWVDERVSFGEAAICPDSGPRELLGPYARAEYGMDWWPEGTYGGKGLSVDDFDGDGHFDVFVPQANGPSHLLFGAGDGTFVERDPDSVLAHVADAAGASSADLDLDGDPDLVVYGFASTPAVLWNDGAGRFTVAPLPTALAGCGGSASLADVDLDGDLDLFQGRLADESVNPPEPCPSGLFENLGGGAFVEVSEQLPADLHTMRMEATGWFQLDADPWPELYAVTDRPDAFDGNRVLDSDGASYEVLTGTGLEQDMAAMGIAIGDLDEDGVWDFAVPGIDEVAVLVSVAEGIWARADWAMGVVPNAEIRQSWGWGGALEDLDNDGLLDLVVSFGPTESDSDGPPQPDEIWRNVGVAGDPLFEPIAAEWGADDLRSMRGFELLDLNRDGWLDLVKREMGGGVVTYVSRCGEGHWLEVELRGAGENPRGVGAVVEIDAAGRTQRRHVVAGSTGFNNSGPGILHFGLGSLTGIDALRIVWPDGEITNHPGGAADRRWSVAYAPDP